MDGGIVDEMIDAEGIGDDEELAAQFAEANSTKLKGGKLKCALCPDADPFAQPP